MSNTKNVKSAHLRPIKILSPQLANQIAAGEVVERPSSVVKELLENSLDAGATNVLIEIEQGGQKRILLRDNGCGIAKDQLALALSRHATSKISNIDDLEHITSMGFRGEALASISSVSRLTLTSKPKEQPQAWQAIAEGAQMDVQLKPAAHPDGTSIEVVDLFFNTPARRKFLRTGKTEFQHIENIVKRIALTRPDVHFELKHNQKICCRYPVVQNLMKRIEQVCGKSMLPNCVQVDYRFDGVTLSGWCSKLGHGQATRDLQYTFVNGRMMKDKLLAHALRQVYEDTLPPQTFACYVLYLQVSPQQIDVNVHPAKHEVRFHQSRQIHDIVFKAINNAISRQEDAQSVNDAPPDSPHKHNYIQPLTALNNTEVNSSFKTQANAKSKSSSAFTETRASNPYAGRSSSYRPNTPSRAELSANHQFYNSVAAVEELKPNVEHKHQNMTSSKSEPVGKDALPTQYLYSSPYVVVGHDDGLQVVHVQILLTAVVTNRIKRSTLAQPLLMPISIENSSAVTQSQLSQFSSVNMMLVVSHQKIIIKQVPSELRQLPWASIFAKLAVNELVQANEDMSKLSSMIADAWLSTLNITNSMISAWLAEVGLNELGELCEKHGKSLHLPSWIVQKDD